MKTETLLFGAMAVILIYIFVLRNPKFIEFSQKLLGDITGTSTPTPTTPTTPTTTEGVDDQ